MAVLVCQTQLRLYDVQQMTSSVSINATERIIYQYILHAHTPARVTARSGDRHASQHTEGQYTSYRIAASNQ
jgi:hypothetical protein